jgi:peroxiredoxin
MSETKTRNKLIMILAGLLVAALGVAYALHLATRPPFEERPPAVGAPAPELHLADLTGSMVSLDALRGRVVLVNFFATWCPPCTDEFAWFERVYDEYGQSGFMVVAVSIDDVTRERAQGLGVSFPLARINDRVKEAYDISGVPVSFLIGPDGRILRKINSTYSEDALRADVSAALGAGGGG